MRFRSSEFLCHCVHVSQHQQLSSGFDSSMALLLSRCTGNEKAWIGPEDKAVMAICTLSRRTRGAGYSGLVETLDRSLERGSSPRCAVGTCIAYTVAEDSLDHTCPRANREAARANNQSTIVLLLSLMLPCLVLFFRRSLPTQSQNEVPSRHRGKCLVQTSARNGGTS